MFDSPLPVVAQKIEPQTIVLLTDLLNQSRPHLSPLSRIHQALEYRVLTALPAILTNASHTPESPPALLGFGVHVVCHHYKHHRASPPRSFPKKTWVPVKISPDKPGQQRRLKIRHQPKRHLLPQKRMLNLLLLPLLIRHQNLFARLIVHHHAAALGPPEPAPLHF